MSFGGLLNQDVTLRTASGFDRDAIGGAEPTYTEAQTLMYLEPGTGGSGGSGGGREVAENRNTSIGDWFGVGYATVDWDSTQQIIYGTHTFEIVAPPRPFRSGLTGAEHHVELDLQEIV